MPETGTSSKMQAMVFEQVGKPLRPVERDIPKPGSGQVLVQVLACAVCRTDLHLIDGELQDPSVPVVPGHEIVGRILQWAARSKTCSQATGSEFRGLAIRAPGATTATRDWRISATLRASRAATSMADMRAMP